VHLQEGAFLAADDMMFVGWCQFWLRFEATQQRTLRSAFVCGGAVCVCPSEL